MTEVNTQVAVPVADTGSADEIVALKRALEWVSGNYRSTLAGKPVRDADECLLHAELLLKPR